MPRILRSYHVWYILLSRCRCECATTLQKQHQSTCPPLPHFSSKLHCTWKFPTQISKTGPLHTFCIHLLWGLRVSTSTDMVQPSPQLNRVSGGITLSNFHSWQSNPTPLHTCKITVFHHVTALSALPGEPICSLTTWSAPVAGMELQVPGCGTQVAATPKCVIIFCVLSSRSVVFHVLYCVVSFIVVGWLHLVWHQSWLPEWMNRTSVKQVFAATVLTGSFWPHNYCQSVILCVFSCTKFISDDN